MNHEDVGRLLGYVAAFDKRTVGRADVLAWHDVLGDLGYEPAKAAVRVWYAENDGMIRPAAIRALVDHAEPPHAKPLRSHPHAPEFDAGSTRRGIAACRRALSVRAS